jgi:hypothetical protein
MCRTHVGAYWIHYDTVLREATICTPGGIVAVPADHFHRMVVELQRMKRAAKLDQKLDTMWASEIGS